jgi:hypothetical protein
MDDDGLGQRIFGVVLMLVFGAGALALAWGFGRQCSSGFEFLSASVSLVLFLIVWAAFLDGISWGGLRKASDRALVGDLVTAPLFFAILGGAIVLPLALLLLAGILPELRPDSPLTLTLWAVAPAMMGALFGLMNCVACVHFRARVAPRELTPEMAIEEWGRLGRHIME